MEYSRSKLNKELALAKLKREYEKITYPSWDPTQHFSKEVCLKAEIQYMDDFRKDPTHWMSKILVFKDDNMLFRNCKTINGIPKDKFLKRFLTFQLIKNASKIDCGKVLSEHCEKLDPFRVSYSKYFDILNSLDKICSIFSTLEYDSKSSVWLASHSEILWKNLAGCLLLKESLIVPDLCIAIAFLMYKLKGKIVEHILPVFVTLMKVTNDCCIYHNSYLSKLHNVESFKINRTTNRETFIKPFEVKETNFLLLSTSFYCQTFLINYNFNETILRELMEALCEMTEMTRHIYLDLLSVIVTKLDTLVAASPIDNEWVKITEMMMDSILTIPSDRNMSNKEDAHIIFLSLKNILTTNIPNYVFKMRRRSSNLEDKMILPRKFTSVTKDSQHKRSYTSNLF